MDRHESVHTHPPAATDFVHDSGVLLLPGESCSVHVPQPKRSSKLARRSPPDDVCGGGETQPQPAVPGAGQAAPLLLTQAARTTRATTRSSGLHRVLDMT